MIWDGSKQIEATKPSSRDNASWFWGAVAMWLGAALLAGCHGDRSVDSSPSVSPTAAASVEPHTGTDPTAGAGDAGGAGGDGRATTGNAAVSRGSWEGPVDRSDVPAVAGSTAATPAPISLSLALTVPETSAALRAEATELMTDLVRQLPQSPDALEVKARMHFLFGENEQAEADWRQALAISPDYGYAHLGIGKAAMRHDRLEEAEQHLVKAMELLPLLEEAALELAQVYTLQGHLERTVSVLQSFVEKKPDAAESWLVLGQSFLALRDYERARQGFARVLELRPDAARAQEGLGRALVRLGQREEAKRLLEAQASARRLTEASNRTPEEAFVNEKKDVARLYVDAGRILVHFQHLDAAELVYRKAILLDPHNMDAWSLFLRLLQQMEKMNEAWVMAGEMCEANPDDATAQLTLALLGARVGELHDPIAAMDRVIELAPQDANAHQTFARLLLENRRDFPRALQLAHRAVELRGSAADHEMYAQTLAVNQQFEKAREELEEAVRLDPDNPLYRGALQQLDAFLQAKSAQ
ncbi:MAG: hypothetical protein D6753_00950 [Planctomycetota bacterium]|nr:MAG: hypothetical protein D6753_00950 [Planctomycetota bacterium]